MFYGIDPFFGMCAGAIKPLPKFLLIWPSIMNTVNSIVSRRISQGDPKLWNILCAQKIFADTLSSESPAATNTQQVLRLSYQGALQGY
jgi:hypothetical protein